MGHTSSVALGYSLFNNNNTICIDGDGSFLMHLGSIKTVGTFANKNPSNQFMDQRGLVISLKENYILKSNISAESPVIWPHLSS